MRSKHIITLIFFMCFISSCLQKEETISNKSKSKSVDDTSNGATQNSGTNPGIDYISNDINSQNTSKEFIAIPQDLPSYNGIASNAVYHTYINSSGTIFASTTKGLSISNNDGESFVTKNLLEGIEWPSIKHFFIDESNKIYLSTLGGGLAISNDNGLSFISKKVDSGLGHDYVSQTYVDSNGKIFVATNGGLSISSNNGETFENKNSAQGLGSSNTKAFTFSDSGTLYLATSGGLTISTDQGENFSNITGFVSNALNHVFIDSSENLYISTSDGLYITTESEVNDPTFDPSLLTRSLENINVKSVNKTSDGKLYVATTSGLYVSSDNGATFNAKTVSSNGLASDNVNFVSIGLNNKIYVSTSYGISITTDSGETFQNINNPDLIKGSTINDVIVTDSGSIYLATNAGVSISSDSGTSFATKQTSDGLGNNYINDLHLHSDGVLYAATTGGLSILNVGQSNFINKTSLRNLCVNDVYVTNTGKIVVTTNGSLETSTNGGNSFSYNTTLNHVGTGDADFKGLTVLSNGDIYAGVSARGIYKKSGSSTGFFWSSTTSKFRHISHIIHDSNDNLYAATYGGLAIFNPGFSGRTTANGLGLDSSSFVAMDSAGLIYVGTYAGLSISTDTTYNSFTNKSINEGLPLLIYSIDFSSDGKIFVGTNMGLYRSK